MNVSSWSGRRVAWVVFLVTLPIYLMSPMVQNGDAYLAGATAASIVTSGNLDIEEFTTYRATAGGQHVVVNGRRYDYFPWPRSLVAVPFAAVLVVGDRLGITPGPVELADGHPEAWMLSMPPAALVTAAAAALAALVAWDLASRRRAQVALLTGFTAAFATSYWSVASRGLWQHGPAALALAFALLAAVRLAVRPDEVHRRSVRCFTLGVGVAAATMTRPSVVPLVLAILAWLALTERRVAPWAVGGIAAVLVPYVGINLIEFGSVTPPYVSAGRLGIHADYAESLAAYLVSTGRGFFVFMPFLGVMAAVGAWTTVRRTATEPAHRRLVVSLAIGLLVFLLMVAAFPENWWGGHSYGPRLLVDAIPLLLVLAVPALEWLVNVPARSALWVTAVILLGWSVFVHAQGGLVRATNCWNVQPTDIDDDPSRIWSIRDPLVLTGARELVRDPIVALKGDCDVR